MAVVAAIEHLTPTVRRGSVKEEPLSGGLEILPRLCGAEHRRGTRYHDEARHIGGPGNRLGIDRSNLKGRAGTVEFHDTGHERIAGRLLLYKEVEVMSELIQIKESFFDCDRREQECLASAGLTFIERNSVVLGTFGRQVSLVPLADARVFAAATCARTGAPSMSSVTSTMAGR